MYTKGTNYKIRPGSTSLVCVELFGLKLFSLVVATCNANAKPWPEWEERDFSGTSEISSGRGYLQTVPQKENFAHLSPGRAPRSGRPPHPPGPPPAQWSDSPHRSSPQGGDDGLDKRRGTWGGGLGWNWQPHRRSSWRSGCLEWRFLLGTDGENRSSFYLWIIQLRVTRQEVGGGNVRFQAAGRESCPCTRSTGSCGRACGRKVRWRRCGCLPWSRRTPPSPWRRSFGKEEDEGESENTPCLSSEVWLISRICAVGWVRCEASHPAVVKTAYTMGFRSSCVGWMNTSPVGGERHQINKSAGKANRKWCAVVAPTHSVRRSASPHRPPRSQSRWDEPWGRSSSGWLATSGRLHRSGQREERVTTRPTQTTSCYTLYPPPAGVESQLLVGKKPVDVV